MRGGHARWEGVAFVVSRRPWLRLWMFLEIRLGAAMDAIED